VRLGRAVVLVPLVFWSAVGWLQLTDDNRETAGIMPQSTQAAVRDSARVTAQAAIDGHSSNFRGPTGNTCSTGMVCPI
jgi:hypothetical protein